MPAARSRSVADRGVPKPRSDAYVGLLSLSLLALTAAMVFAYLNYNGMAEKPKQVQAAPKGGGPAQPPAQVPPPGPGGAQPPPGQQPGAQPPPPAPGKQPGPPQQKQ